MLPSGNDLTYFIEVAKLGSVSLAASKLGLSQPSITLSIKRLEQSLQVNLFIRTKKGVKLTSAGRELFLKGQKLLDDWQELRDSTIQQHTQVAGHYRIGCHPSVGLYTLKYFLPELMKNYPGLEIKVIHDHSKGITQKVIDLEVDVAIVVNPVQHPDLVIRKLFNDEVCLWRGPGPKNEDVLICDPALVQTGEIVKKLKKSKIDFGRVLTSNNLENIISLTAGGAGFGIIPGRVVGEFPRANLTKVSSAPVFRDEICLIYRLENKSIKAIEVMAKTIFESLT